MLKHSGAAQARVCVTYVADGVDIEILDTGRGGRSVPHGGVVASGHGLVGLRERTRLLGGVLEYGALDGSGFRVAAHLPSTEPGSS